jgi:hypothetical protein
MVKKQGPNVLDRSTCSQVNAKRDPKSRITSMARNPECVIPDQDHNEAPTQAPHGLTQIRRCTEKAWATLNPHLETHYGLLRTHTSTQDINIEHKDFHSIFKSNKGGKR